MGLASQNKPMVRSKNLDESQFHVIETRQWSGMPNCVVVATLDSLS
jgi:hypothetical protein